MLEYQVGHIYLREWAVSWRLIKVTEIRKNKESPIYFIGYSPLATNNFFINVDTKLHFFLCTSLEMLSSNTKEVLIKDLPLYISADRIFPEFKRILENA